MSSDFFVFTDGACLKNPGPGGWGVVIFQFVSKIPSRVVELGGYCLDTTNNKMELLAVTKALKYISKPESNIHIYCDSKYVVKGVHEWLFLWIRNNWKTSLGKEVLNKELWVDLSNEIIKKKDSSSLSFTHVPSHMGLSANERADFIASNFIKNRAFNLYNGHAKNYIFQLDINRLDEEIKRLTSKKKNQKNKKAFSYVSMIQKKIIVHKTWADCEARVKGKSNAKYKKALSKEEELEIIKSWQ